MNSLRSPCLQYFVLETCGGCHCYNVQPGIEINYSTGENHLVENEGNNTTPSDLSITYIINTNTKKFHLITCASVDKISEKNKAEYTGFKSDSLMQNYIPCSICKP